MEKIELNNFLRTLTYGMQYTILEESKNKDELAAVAEKHHLMVPCKDLSVFKGTYAFVNEENLNGCTLPKDEVEKALNTLNGKSVDFDHLRKKIVGYWLEGSMQGDAIVAYGVFFKGSLVDEYEELQTLFNEGKLKISFEAWGNRIYTNGSTTSYELKDIEFAGGALLINTTPAFPGASVLELAKNMKAPVSFIIEKGEDINMAKNKNKFMELSRFYLGDLESMLGLLSQVQCPGCGEPYSQDVNSIDFMGGTMDTTCYLCDANCTVNMTPKVKQNNENASSYKEAKIKLKEDNPNLEESKKMEEKIKDLEAKLKTLEEASKTKEDENASLKASLEDLTKKLEEAKKEVEDMKANKEAELKVAREEATLIANRKSELGDFAKEMTDEHILNDDKYEVAKLKKENAELKAKAAVTTETASTNVEAGSSKVTLEAGSKNVEDDVIAKKQKRISELAFASK